MDFHTLIFGAIGLLTLAIIIGALLGSDGDSFGDTVRKGLYFLFILGLIVLVLYLYMYHPELFDLVPTPETPDNTYNDYGENISFN